MSNRIDKVVRKYLEQKPAIDREREFRSHTQNARRHATRIHQAAATMNSIVKGLPDRNRDELRQMAKSLQIKGSWKMSKAALVEAITNRLKV